MDPLGGGASLKEAGYWGWVWVLRFCSPVPLPVHFLLECGSCVFDSTSSFCQAFPNVMDCIPSLSMSQNQSFSP